jgi:hypothetical protein
MIITITLGTKLIPAFKKRGSLAGQSKRNLRWPSAPGAQAWTELAPHTTLASLRRSKLTMMSKRILLL